MGAPKDSVTSRDLEHLVSTSGPTQGENRDPGDEAPSYQSCRSRLCRRPVSHVSGHGKKRAGPNREVAVGRPVSRDGHLMLSSGSDQPRTSSALGKSLAKSSLLGQACRAASRSAPVQFRAASVSSE